MHKKEEAEVMTFTTLNFGADGSGIMTSAPPVENTMGPPKTRKITKRSARAPYIDHLKVWFSLFLSFRHLFRVVFSFVTQISSNLTSGYDLLSYRSSLRPNLFIFRLGGASHMVLVSFPSSLTTSWWSLFSTLRPRLMRVASQLRVPNFSSRRRQHTNTIANWIDDLHLTPKKHTRPNLALSSLCNLLKTPILYSTLRCCVPFGRNKNHHYLVSPWTFRPPVAEKVEEGTRKQPNLSSRESPSSVYLLRNQLWLHIKKPGLCYHFSHSSLLTCPWYGEQESVRRHEDPFLIPLNILLFFLSSVVLHLMSKV